jgi:hypothetical protein
MPLNHKHLKPVINAVFLTLSCFLITYFLIQLTDNLLMKIGVGLFAIALDVFMQYVLGLGKSYFKTQKFRAVILFACYAAYVIIYAVPSAIGFFAVEIATQEQATAKTEIAATINRQRLTQINQTVKALNAQLTKEAGTGYGPRSQNILTKIEALTNEQKQIESSFSAPWRSKNVPKNIFGSLGQVFGIPANILKIFIFGTSVLMLYLGLILTSWDVRIEVNIQAEKTSSVNVTSEKICINENKQELSTFIDALFEGTKRRLNGNDPISKKTGLPFEKCVRFRELLGSLIIKDLPAINIVQGASTANYPKEIILDYISNNC